MLRWMILGWVGMLTSGMAACAQQTAVAADEDAPVIRAMSPQEIARGLESHDRALFIKTGWMRDPYIVVGPDGLYYLTGTTRPADDGQDEANPHRVGRMGWQVRVWRSPDLIQWAYMGEPYSLKDGIWWTTRREQFEQMPQRQWRLWAPELHFIDGRWFVVHTSPAPVHMANLSVTRGPELRGPWDNPMGEGIGRKHDPSLFHDEDGTIWLVWHATELAPLKPDLSGFAAEPIHIGPKGRVIGHEGSLIRKIGGKYVLFGTGWSRDELRKGTYNLYYCVSDKITGPYGERKFAGRFLGHGTPFQDKQGRWWCTAFYNADVPPLSREQARGADLGHDAHTINEQGVTIVPLEVRVEGDGEIYIRAKDPDYATPGPDEVQKFER